MNDLTITIYTTVTPAKAWVDMPLNERVIHAAALTGKEIRYALRAEYDEGVKVFGPNYPIKWHEGTLVELTPYQGKAAIKVSTPGPWRSFNMPIDKTILFDDLQFLKLYEGEVTWI